MRVRGAVVAAAVTGALVVGLLAVQVPAPAAAEPAEGPPSYWPGLLAVRMSGSAQGSVDVPGVRSIAPVFPAAAGRLAAWHFVRVEPGTEETVARRLAAGADVVTRMPVRLPAGVNDPRLPEQWYVQRIRAPQAWAVTRGSPSVRVAVIDTQFDTAHPDLRGKLTDRHGTTGAVQRYTGGCPPGVAFADHGTQVAGVAAATTDNQRGIAGIGFSTRVLAAQTGTVIAGACAVGPQWVTALHDAVVAGARVVNLSFAGQGTNSLEADTIRYAVARGTLVVAAAGNGASTEPHFPAAYPHVLAVAGVGRDDRLRARSNRGPWVDIAAPAEDLLTTCRPATYCRVSGTSSASAVVAGSAALTLARWGDRHSGLALRHILTDAAARVTGRAFDPAIGHGRVDLARAVQERVVRIWGGDRVDTAAAVAQHAARTATAVVLVPADGDGGWRSTLPAAGLLGVHSTTFVMTRRDRLDAAAQAELLRLFDGGGGGDSRRTVIIPGGADVSVSEGVEAQLARRFTVTRIAGPDAASTAARLADAIVSRSQATTVLVARGDDPADALSLAGPAARHGLPILFVGRDRVPAATCDWIAAHPDTTRIIIAGGSAAVTSAVEERLRTCRGWLAEQVRRVDIVRDAGDTRVGTSLAIARRWFPEARSFIVANGWRWPDAVAGGGLSRRADAPILLTRAGDLHPAVARYVDARTGRDTPLWILGGAAVVAPAVERSLEHVAR